VIDRDETITGTMEPLCEPRTKTAPQPKTGHRIEIDLDDPDSLSDFLLQVSKLIREKRRVVIIIE